MQRSWNNESASWLNNKNVARRSFDVRKTLCSFKFFKMIRILFDELGDSHGDIFFKVDVVPSFVQVVDMYFIGDFLENEKQAETKEELMIAFIDYIEERIISVSKEETFVPIDLSDQYVGGLLISQKNSELITVKYGWTDKIYGFAIGRGQVDQIMNDQKPEFEIERDWLIAKVAVLHGLDWSRKKILNNAAR
jgi:hypothetical protein